MMSTSLQAADVRAVTGLSRDELREWTNRHKFIEPDTKPSGRGRFAQYSWQTVLVLMVLKELRDRYSVTLSKWGKPMRELRSELESVPFHSLYGKVVHFESTQGRPTLVAPEGRWESSCLAVAVDSHLNAIVSKLSGSPPDRTLFPAVAVT